MRVQQLVDDGNSGYDEAVETLSQHGAPSSPTYYDLYRDLVCGVLGRDQRQEEKADQAAVVASLRSVLYNVGVQLRAQSTDQKIDMEFEGLLMAAHYTHMMYARASEASARRERPLQPGDWLWPVPLHSETPLACATPACLP